MDSRICSVSFPRHFPMPGSVAVAFLVIQQIAEIIMGPGIAWIGGNGTFQHEQIFQAVRETVVSVCCTPRLSLELSQGWMFQLIIKITQVIMHHRIDIGGSIQSVEDIYAFFV